MVEMTSRHAPQSRTRISQECASERTKDDKKSSRFSNPTALQYLRIRVQRVAEEKKGVRGGRESRVEIVYSHIDCCPLISPKAHFRPGTGAVHSASRHSYLLEMATLIFKSATVCFQWRTFRHRHIVFSGVAAVAGNLRVNNPGTYPATEERECKVL